jgi:DNA replication protein DnaC
MNPYRSFAEYLDTYQSKKQLQFVEGIELLYASQTHYQTHYQPYYAAIYPDSNVDSLMKKMRVQSSYLNWQNEHIVHLETKKEEIPKLTRHIDVDLKTLRDMVELLRKNPVEEHVEYNIDLKSLHKVKSEIEEINNMIGLASLKTSILRQLIYFIQGFGVLGDYKHTVLTGPPGVGKTEIAKLIGKMYSKLGILKKNVFKKVTRADLVAGYLGQTAIKTKKVVDECEGGVLFIDEAYSLHEDDSFAKECVDTLCEALSDRKNDWMVIVTGYEKELENTFFKINSGMKSRFIWWFSVEPYTPSELCLIFQKMVVDQEWKLPDPIPWNSQWFSDNKSFFVFNGRDMELLFSYVKIAHAQRVYGSNSEKRVITMEDLKSGMNIFKENKKSKSSGDLFGLYT